MNRFLVVLIVNLDEIASFIQCRKVDFSIVLIDQLAKYKISNNVEYLNLTNFVITFNIQFVFHGVREE